MKPIIEKSVAEEQLHQDAENVIAYKAYKDLTKSLTYSGHKLQGRTKLYGMDISIENKKGSYRSGVDSDGHKWKTYMHYDYGYIRGTVGTDSDHVDCYIGPDKNAKKVYVIHQNNPITHKYDEDKCMLCFKGAVEAKKAYMKQYDRPGFFGSMETLSIDQFKSFVFSKQGSKIQKSLGLDDIQFQTYLFSKENHKNDTFAVVITDITENNKEKKVEQLQKSLNCIYKQQPFSVRHIKSDILSQRYDDITLVISNFNKDKIEKAVNTASFALDVKPKSKHKGEQFFYKSQENLTDEIIIECFEKVKKMYLFVLNYFALPDVRIVSKANLKYKGKIIYNPETGDETSTFSLNMNLIGAMIPGAITSGPILC